MKKKVYILSKSFHLRLASWRHWRQKAWNFLIHLFSFKNLIFLLMLPSSNYGTRTIDYSTISASSSSSSSSTLMTLTVARNSTLGSSATNTESVYGDIILLSSTGYLDLTNTSNGLKVGSNSYVSGSDLYTLKYNTGTLSGTQTWSGYNTFSSGITTTYLTVNNEIGLGSSCTIYANGYVLTPTILGYLNGLSSNCQSQITSNTNNISTLTSKCGNITSAGSITIPSGQTLTMTGNLYANSTTISPTV